MNWTEELLKSYQLQYRLVKLKAIGVEELSAIQFQLPITPSFAYWLENQRALVSYILLVIFEVTSVSI